jgi:hypothetical protein
MTFISFASRLTPEAKMNQRADSWKNNFNLILTKSLIRQRG